MQFCLAFAKVRDVLPDLAYKLKITPAKKPLGEMEPIAIVEKDNNAKSQKMIMSGYKEVWNNARACQSLLGEGFYEAGASITWTSLEPSSGVPCDSPTLEQVMASRDLFCPLDMGVAGRARILWPGAVLCCLDDSRMENIKDQHPQDLALVGNKALVMAWWVPCTDQSQIFLCGIIVFDVKCK